MTQAKANRITGATITLRQIEALEPCGHSYFKFIRQMKMNPVPGGVKSQAANDYGHKNVKQPAYGPDAPILLSEIARVSGDGEGYVNWLLHRAQRSKAKGLEGLKTAMKSFNTVREQKRKEAAVIEKQLSKLQGQADNLLNFDLEDYIREELKSAKATTKTQKAAG